MIIKNTAKIILISIASIFCALPLLADAPYERYHVSYKDISEDILKETIGILTINSGVKKGKKVRTYLRTEDKFTFDKVLKIEETTPVSNYGYQPPIDELGIENYRFPVVAKVDQYLCIVYEPKKNLRGWINLGEMEQDFYTDLVILDSIPVPSEFFVDIFYFTDDGIREIYKDIDKAAVTISKELFEGSLLKVTDQKNGFIKIEGPAFINHDIGKGQIELSGWIRIRDDRGNLTIWIIDVDQC
jgi:hypothetical protein